MRTIAIGLLLLLMNAISMAQTKFASLPSPIDKNGRFLFYLHGGVVTILGDNCINNGAPEWGRYEYSNILDSLRTCGFYVVSERRFPDVADSLYAIKICKQIDTLLNAGVPIRNIVIVSASAGWTISYRVSAWLKNDSLHFIKMGGCRPGDDPELEYTELHGQFLSIIEKTDSRGSCQALFARQKHIAGYMQVELNTGLGHGFFYKGRKVWIDPIVEWFEKHATGVAPTAFASLPKPIDKKGRYLFYQHGGVVSNVGDNAINRGAPEWGPYEYSNILDSLRTRGFYIVSERRFLNVKDSVYAIKVCKQIDSLLQNGVPVENIIVVGASSGWNITTLVSQMLKNNMLHYVIMGGCWPDDYKEYVNRELYGHFLSIIETSDPHGTCDKLFEGQKRIARYKQVVLNTGLSHGFFYKGRKVWIDPIVEWFGKK